MTYFYNNTSTYARTKKLTVTVRDREGKPAKGAEVSFEILNMAEYCSVATLRTDEKGEVSLTMGLGDIHIRAMLDGWFGEASFLRRIRLKSCWIRILRGWTG